MRQHVQATDRFSVSPSAVFEQIHDEAVILDTRHELYLALNASGACIWDAVAGGESVEGAANRLAERYPVTLERARQDTVDLIRDLLARELLQPVT